MEEESGIRLTGEYLKHKLPQISSSEYFKHIDKALDIYADYFKFINEKSSDGLLINDDNSKSNTITEILNVVNKINGRYESRIPTIKGRTGEIDILNMLRSYFTETVFEHSKSGNQYGADIVMKIPETSVTCAIEVKNYKSTVSSTITNKFIKDLDQGPHQYGIFISIDSFISKQSLLQITLSNSGKPIIWVPDATKEYIVASINLVKIVHKLKSKTTNSEEELINKIKLANSYIVNLVAMLSSLKKVVDKSSKQIDKIINDTMKFIDLDLASF